MIIGGRAGLECWIRRDVRSINQVGSSARYTRLVPDPSSRPSCTLAVNTLAPYVLTALIERPGRLVYLGSGVCTAGGGGVAGRYRLDEAGLGTGTGLCRKQAARDCARLRGGARAKMGGLGAPVDLDTGQRTQTWLAVSEEPAPSDTATGAVGCATICDLSERSAQAYMRLARRSPSRAGAMPGGNSGRDRSPIRPTTI